jgi:hypothetical protein
MATCPNGHKNPDSQRFCGECGARIQTASERKTIAAKAKPRSNPNADFESGRISLAEFLTNTPHSARCLLLKGQVTQHD